jgi:hypothetical protein
MSIGAKEKYARASWFWHNLTQPGTTWRIDALTVSISALNGDRPQKHWGKGHFGQTENLLALPS